MKTKTNKPVVIGEHNNLSAWCDIILRHGEDTKKREIERKNNADNFLKKIDNTGGIVKAKYLLMALDNGIIDATEFYRELRILCDIKEDK